MIEIPEERICRKYFLLEVVARFSPEFIGALIRKFISIRIRVMLSKYLDEVKVEKLLIQGSIGQSLRDSSRRNKVKIYMTISTAAPSYFQQIMEIEKSENPKWFPFFSAPEFSNRFAIEFENDVRAAHKIFAPSEFVRKTIQNSLNQNKVEVINLGANLTELGIDCVSNHSRALRRKGDPLRIVYVGQVQQRKGVSYLVNGFSKANLPDGSKLTFVGTSVNGSIKYIQGINPEIEFTGHRSRYELGEILNTQDVFILPSLAEGFALSAIEAMSTGLPVIVTEIVMQGVITNRVDGILIKPRDESEITRVLEWVADHPIEVTDIGKKGAIRSKAYSWDNYQTRIVELLNH